MNNKKKRDVYVLTRIYNSYKEGSKFLERLAAAAASVAENAKSYKQGKVIWMLYDDSPNNSRYLQHKNELLKLCLSYGFEEKEKGNLIYVQSEMPGNSAYASFCIRKQFLSIAKENDIAVSLDQDDELRPGAIKSIVENMPKNGVVLSSFTVIDDGGKDITGDGGKIQKKLTKYISKHRIDNSTASKTYDSKENNLKEIFYASSIGWTKSYSRFAMEKNMEALEGFLNEKRVSVIDYYSKHPAYEDFVDFYILLRSDITISATPDVTHTYYKHKEAITTNPDIDSFKLHRTAMLLTLIDLCYKEADNLRPDFKQLLMRFVTIKVVDIERILADYRKNFNDGDNRYYTFAEDTHDDYFLRKLYRLSQGDNRGKEQDKELFENAEPIRCDKTKDNFDDLFSCENINSIKVYHAEMKAADSRHVLQKAFIEENKFRKEQPFFQKSILHLTEGICYYVNECKKWCKKKMKKWIWEKEEKNEEDISKRYDNKPTPNQRRYWFMVRVLIVLTLAIIGFVSWALSNKFIESNSELFASILALMAAVLTFYLNEQSKIHLLANEEATKKKLYFSEFEDLLRHLEANLKVMIEIRRQMDMNEGKMPASIHFVNLSWPQSSCLFSDDISEILDKKKVDDFARLKVNLRNIQNSSMWLSKYVREPHTNEEICKAIDWEIARHIGYLMNIHYMQNNNFSFPSQNELDFYIREKHLKNYLAGMFMSYHGDDKDKDGRCQILRMKMVNHYLDIYYDDRRERRNVILYNL